MVIGYFFVVFFFFFKDPAPPEFSPLSLPDPLPFSVSRSLPAALIARAIPKSATRARPSASRMFSGLMSRCTTPDRGRRDRKSTRLNSSHLVISYAVFCLKKKNTAESVCSATYHHT